MTENTSNTEQKAITPYQKIKNFMRSDEVVVRFREILGDRGASAYISSVLIAVANSDTLQECTPGSVMISAMRAATLHLSCDPVTGEAWIIPFKNKATFVAGYKGLVKMAIRTDKYRYLHVSRWYEGEILVEDRMKGIHRFEGSPNAERKTAGWLFYMELYNGFVKTLPMTVEEIHAHAKHYSKSYDKPDGIWKKNTEEMERKTVMRLGLTRYGFLDPADLAILNETDETEPNGDETTIDARFHDTDKPRSQEEILSELGFDPESPPSSPEPAVNLTVPGMTLEEAHAVTAKDGTLYKAIPSDELRYHLKGLQDSLVKNTLDTEKRSLYERKVTAIKLVLQFRDNPPASSDE